MKTKEEILAEIEKLKTAKPERWKSQVYELLRELSNVEFELDSHSYQGTEAKGRSRGVRQLPLRDKSNDPK